ncbi:hypothetical protein [Armatimonas sp.]|uniref:hypothetical protein n=1 Tax=Armatimonas sp. TaxID=1872638 RepID=UPI00374DCB92
MPYDSALNLPEALPAKASSDSVVVNSSALTRPLVLSSPREEPSRREHTPPATSPSGLSSYDEALAAVFSNAGLAEDKPSGSSEIAAASPPLSVRYSPEDVVVFLSSLPGHLSQDSRFRCMEEELQQRSESDPAELVGDAAAQLVQIRQELNRHTTEYSESIQATRWRIEFLEAELARMREQLAEREQEGREHRRELLTKVDEMTGVIVFFDGFQSYLLQRSDEEEKSAPTFLDDAAAMRLLDQRKAA